MQGFKHGRVFDSKMKAIFLGAFYHINNIAVTVRNDNVRRWMWEVTKNDTCTWKHALWAMYTCSVHYNCHQERKLFDLLLNIYCWIYIKKLIQWHQEIYFHNNLLLTGLQRSFLLIYQTSESGQNFGLSKVNSLLFTRANNSLPHKINFRFQSLTHIV